MSRPLRIVALVLASVSILIASSVGTGALWWALAGGRAAASFDDDQPPGAPVIPGAETDEEDFDGIGIGFGSIGAIDITMTAQQAIGVLGSGQTNEIEYEQCSSFLLGMRGEGPRTYGMAESEGAYGPLDTITLQAGWNGEETTYGVDLDLPRTRAGITLGATVDELVAAYPGGALDLQPHPYYENGNFAVLMDGADLGILFSVNDEGRVDYITTGRYPQIVYPEGCH